MELPKEERKKQLELLKELRDFCLEENQKMIEKENGPLGKRLVHKLRVKLHLYPKFETRVYALVNFKSASKYLSEKHNIIDKSITMEMIDAETPKTLKKGSKPYINVEQKIRDFQEKMKEEKQRH